LMNSEVKPDQPPRAAHQLVDRRVTQRPPELALPQVHEHEVRLQRAVLLVHVIRPQADQLARDRHRPARAALAPRAAATALARDDLNPPPPRDDILMPQPQRLPD